MPNLRINFQPTSCFISHQSLLEPPLELTRALPVNYRLNESLLRLISHDASVPQRLEQSKYISVAKLNNKKSKTSREMSCPGEEESRVQVQRTLVSDTKIIEKAVASLF